MKSYTCLKFFPPCLQAFVSRPTFRIYNDCTICYMHMVRQSLKLLGEKNSVSTFSGLTALSANCLIFDQQDFSISGHKVFSKWWQSCRMSFVFSRFFWCLNLYLCRSSERKRRQVYRSEIHGMLPFETHGMDNPVPTVDFSPTGNTEAVYSFERTDVDGEYPALSNMVQRWSFSSM
jgi:hypothetical protein